VAVLQLFPLGLVLWNPAVSGAWINSILFSVLLAAAWNRLPERVSPPAGSPHPAEQVVRQALSGLYFVDAGVLWAHDLTLPALGIQALFVLGWFWKRRWLKSPAVPPAPSSP
jgi:hypothetical protein